MSNDMEEGKPTNELMAQFVANHTKELELRTQELELEKQKDAHNFEFGKEALSAQERDRIHERDIVRQQQRDRYRLVLWILVILAGLVFCVTWLGKEQLALEILKIIGPLVAGGVGGYGLAIAKHKQVHESQPQDKS